MCQVLYDIIMQEKHIKFVEDKLAVVVIHNIWASSLVLASI